MKTKEVKEAVARICAVCSKEILPGVKYQLVPKTEKNEAFLYHKATCGPGTKAWEKFCKDNGRDALVTGKEKAKKEKKAKQPKEKKEKSERGFQSRKPHAPAAESAAAVKAFVEMLDAGKSREEVTAQVFKIVKPERAAEVQRSMAILWTLIHDAMIAAGMKQKRAA